MCYWFSCDLIPAYWCVIDSHGTSFQHTDVLLIFMWPLSNVLMCYWFSCDLLPAYWSVINYHVTSFHHNDVLMILMWPHSNTLMCYWFSWYLILQHTDVVLILMLPHYSILRYCCFSWYLIFIWETGYWTRAMKRFLLFDLLKSLYSDTKILSKYIPSLQKRL